MLRVTPIYGSRWSDDGEAQGPQCTLVEYADCRVLVNVGWKEVDFPALPAHDALVLSDSTLECIGGLPIYYRQWKENNRKGEEQRPLPPIYSTFPVVKMGQMTLYDLHAAICMDGGSPPFSLQDVDDAFTAISAIKYSHPQRLGPPNADPTLTITAHRAGHAVGAAFFVMQRLQDDTKVVVTATYNIARELHLDSSTLVQEGSTPDVLVTRPGGPALRTFHELTQVPAGKRTAPLPHMLATQVQRNLSDTILSVLRREGNVLLPVDAASRSLELIFLLNQHWERNRLRSAYHLVWLGPMVPNTVDFARSQLEWMGAKLGQSFLDSQDGSKGGQHPWSMPNVHFLQSVNDLQTLLQENPNPAAVVASGASLESGPSRDVLLQWADNPDNAILMTDSSQALLRPKTPTTSTDTVTPSDAAAGTAATTGTAAGATEDSDIIGQQLNPDEERSKWTTAGQLLNAWGQAKKEGLNELDSVNCDVPVRVKRPLQGAELKAFLAREESARQAQIEEDKQKAMLREVELAKGQLRLGEDEKRGTLQSVSAVDNTQKGTSISPRPRKKSRFDQSLFLKFSKPLHMFFEVREAAVGIGQKDSTAKYGIGESIGRQGEVMEDDYGIAVLPEKFTDIVSGVDPSKFGARVGEEVLRKGFGYGVTGPNQGRSGGPARVSEDEGNGENTGMDEAALEALDLSEGHGIVRGRGGQPPSKVFVVWRKIEVLAEVSYIPLEGRVDAKQARFSVKALQPRHIVVLGGPSPDGVDGVHDEVRILAKDASNHATDGYPVLTPVDGETASLRVGHAAYPVRLSDTPYEPADELASSNEPAKSIELHETEVGQCMVSKLDYAATGKKYTADGSFGLAPRLASVDSVPSVYVSDGEVLLSDLGSVLSAEGMKAEYSNKQGYAQIIVNGHIFVKKDHSSGKILVEGPLCQDFWTVRRIVCGRFVVL